MLVKHSLQFESDFNSCMVRLKAGDQSGLTDAARFQFLYGAIKSRSFGNKKMPFFKALQK